MEPRFFGPFGGLFGIYHPATTRADRDVGVVVCNPFGREALYAHRALKQTAILLADAGFHVLRFDYSSTGDSQGPSDAADPERWVSDIGVAVDELGDAAGLRSFALLGMRLGASLAFRAALRRSDVEGLVLWEPVARGSAYLREVAEHHKEWASGIRLLDEGQASAAEYLGFPITAPLSSWLASLDLGVGAVKRPSRNAFVLTHADDENNAAWIAAVEGLSCRVERRVVPGPAIWLRGDAGSRVRVPRDAVNAMVEWCARTL